MVRLEAPGKVRLVNRFSASYVLARARAMHTAAGRVHRQMRTMIIACARVPLVFQPLPHQSLLGARATLARAGATCCAALLWYKKPPAKSKKSRIS